MTQPVTIRFSDHPDDFYVVPCTCKHDYAEHRTGGKPCKGLDSYDCPCECPYYEADPNIIADFDDGQDG